MKNVRKLGSFLKMGHHMLNSACKSEPRPITRCPLSGPHSGLTYPHSPLDTATASVTVPKPTPKHRHHSRSKPATPVTGAPRSDQLTSSSSGEKILILLRGEAGVLMLSNVKIKDQLSNSTARTRLISFKSYALTVYTVLT